MTDRDETQPEHVEVQAMLAGAALGALNPEEHWQVQRHLADCGVCREEMVEFGDTASCLLDALPVVHADSARTARVRVRLMARAQADVAGPARRSLGGPGARGHWAGWAVAAGLGSLLLTHHGFHRPISYGWVAAGGLAALLLAVTLLALRLQRQLRSLLRERSTGEPRVRS